jgi:hypothetical protein
MIKKKLSYFKQIKTNTVVKPSVINPMLFSKLKLLITKLSSWIIAFGSKMVKIKIGMAISASPIVYNNTAAGNWVFVFHCNLQIQTCLLVKVLLEKYNSQKE